MWLEGRRFGCRGGVGEHETCPSGTGCDRATASFAGVAKHRGVSASRPTRGK